MFTEEELHMSLGSHGYLGCAKDDDEEKYTIFYDFKPAVSGPLLLKEPQLIVPADKDTSTRVLL